LLSAFGMLSFFDLPLPAQYKKLLFSFFALKSREYKGIFPFFLTKFRFVLLPAFARNMKLVHIKIEQFKFYNLALFIS
jgi:hypothetical protein